MGTVAAKPQSEDKGGCGKLLGGCLKYSLFAILALVIIIVAGPSILQFLGIGGPPAEVVYSGAPDLYAGEQVQAAFEERGITGVRVYVIPIKDEAGQSAFIILDASEGYTGLSPAQGSDGVFREVLQDLSDRNQEENLRIHRVAIDYRDENGDSAFSFTTTQENVDAFANGQVSREKFFASVDFPIGHTLRYLGIDDVLRDLSE